MRGVVLLATLAAWTAQAGDWPQLLGPDRSATSTEKAIPTDWDKNPPLVLWQRDVGLGYSSPVISDGKLILFHRVGDRETVEAIEAKSGKNLWTFDYPTEYQDPLGKGNGPRSTPTIVGNRVYTLGPSGMLTCLDTDAGKKVWQRDLARDYTLRESFFGVGSSPLVEGDLVIVNVGDRQAGIVAWNRETGKEVWRATNHDASYASGVAATLDGQRRLVFFTREGLVGLDPTNGKVVFEKRWRARINASVNAASPVVRGNQVFISACYDTGAIVHQVEKDALTVIWEGEESLSCHYSTPVVAGEHLYGFDGREEEGARLRCADWATGKVRWSADGYGCGSILRVGSALLVLTQDGRIEAVDVSPARHTVLGSKKVLTGPVRAHLALADRRIFARDNRKLVALGWKE